MAWSLELFEHKVYAREREEAARLLFELLKLLDAHYGEIPPELTFRAADGLSAQDAQSHMVTRICSAIGCLMSDPQFYFTHEGLQQLIVRHRWLATLFGASPFVNTDHILRALNLKQGEDEAFELPQDQLEKFCLLYGPESTLSLDLNVIHARDPILAISLGLVLMSPRFMGSRVAHAKRETLLEWLPERLRQVQQPQQLPLDILHDVYMHCSYAQRQDRHAIKAAINQVICRVYEHHGIADRQDMAPPAPGALPVLLVVLEWFTKGHSIYRTHSRTLEGAKRHFRVVGVAFTTALDEVTSGLFDELRLLDSSVNMLQLMRQIQALASELNAQVLYMPSVGMFPLTMFLSNLRVAPLQVIGLGHPATTHSPRIDCVVVEEDYVGDPACFSEQLLRLPRDGMPYRPSELATLITPHYLRKAPSEAVDVVVAATTMKLNPEFLGTCAEIAARSRKKVRFHFLVGQALGLIYPAVSRVVREHLGEAAVVYRHQPYERYIAIISECDLFINPFPFGNTNGIIDTVSAGLVGVCKSGPEVFEHIDEALFRRLALPEWLIASSVQEYVAAALRLIEDDQERLSLRRSHAGPAVVKQLFSGNATAMGERLRERLNECWHERQPQCAPPTTQGQN